MNRSSNRSHVPTSDTVRPKTPPPAPASPTEKIHAIETQKLNECTKEKMNSVAGPPVYYPPGPLFAKKEEYSVVSSEQVRISKWYRIGYGIDKNDKIPPIQ